jgi:2-oxoglutarate/2-oxoacid ferredoxin oxidoreductase subunit beta
MSPSPFDRPGVETAWCPGCGNVGLRNAVLNALTALDLDRTQLVLVSGIGQAAKAPQYYDVSYFNGLHGRALAHATGIKAANPSLTVVVESGDGDLYGEGGNHFLHAIRRNPDLTVIAHDNMVYGLTKGQAAPTSQRGMVTPVQVYGVTADPINPVHLAIALGATFVAQGAVGQSAQLQDLIQQAIRHRGFALVNVFQACPSFNKLNTHQWFKDNTQLLDASHDPADKAAALARAEQTHPWPLGVLYRETGKPTFEEQLSAYRDDPAPLFRRNRSPDLIRRLLRERT